MQSLILFVCISLVSVYCTKGKAKDIFPTHLDASLTCKICSTRYGCCAAQYINNNATCSPTSGVLITLQSYTGNTLAIAISQGDVFVSFTLPNNAEIVSGWTDKTFFSVDTRGPRQWNEAMNATLNDATNTTELCEYYWGCCSLAGPSGTCTAGGVAGAVGTFSTGNTQCSTGATFAWRVGYESTSSCAVGLQNSTNIYYQSWKVETKSSRYQDQFQLFCN